jgi:hypothetical protein
MQRGDNNEEFNFGAAFQCHFSHHHKQNESNEPKRINKSNDDERNVASKRKKKRTKHRKKTYFAIMAPNAHRTVLSVLCLIQLGIGRFCFSFLPSLRLMINVLLEPYIEECQIRTPFLLILVYCKTAEY